MDIILVFALLLFTTLAFLFLTSRLQYKKGQRLLRAFSGYNLEEMEIRFSETSTSGLNQFGGSGNKARLYHGKGILLVTSTDKWFNRLHNNLPILFTTLERKELPIGFSTKTIEDFRVDKYIQYTLDKNAIINRRVEISLSSEKDPDRLKQILENFKVKAGQQVKTLL